MALWRDLVTALGGTNLALTLQMKRKLMALFVRVSSVWAFVFIVLGCESGAGPIHNETSPVWEDQRWLQSAEPVVHLVIVDDSPSREANSLREQIGLESEDLYDRMDARDCGIIADPAYFRAVDRQMIVVGASRPERGLHAGNFPGLHFRAANASASAQRDWAEAVEEALGELVTEEPQPPRVIDALEYWFALLGGQRPPQNEDEERLLESLSARPWLEIAILVTRPDESQSQSQRSSPYDLANEFIRPNDRAARHVRGGTTVSGLVDASSASCGPSKEEVANVFPRLAPLVERWESMSCETRMTLGSTFIADCGPYACLPEPVHRDEGGVECTILTHVDPGTQCEEAWGWRDPAGASGEPEERYQQSEGLLRVCEIVQLQGEALESCQNDLECDACKPGWCLRNAWPDEDYDWHAGLCRYKENLPSEGLFRFTGGSDQGVGLIEIICDTDEI